MQATAIVIIETPKSRKRQNQAGRMHLHRQLSHFGREMATILIEPQKLQEHPHSLKS